MGVTQGLKAGALTGTLVLIAACSQAPVQQSTARVSVTDLFTCLDGNDNGYLEVGELQNASACELEDAVDMSELPDSRKRRAEALITAMDIDGDERISDIEFRGWYTR